MSPAVTVVVGAHELDDQLKALVASLDGQSLPWEAYELVLVDAGLSPTDQGRLRQLAASRPNYTFVEAVDGAAPSGEEHGSGDFVLRLRQDQRLFPEALERLHAAAVGNGLDAVAGRISSPGVAVPPLFTDDSDLLDDASVESALAGDAVLVRRTGDGVAQPQRVGVLASVPALAQPGPAEETETVVRQDELSATWAGRLLHVRATGELLPPAAGWAAGSSLEALVVVRHAATGLSYLLPAAEAAVHPLPEADASEDGQSAAAPAAHWEATFDVDVTTVAAGTPLGDGRWELDVQLRLGAMAGSLAPVTLAWAPCPPAVVGGAVVVPAPADASPTFQLDLGPTTWPLVSGLDAGAGTVTESAQGSLLDLPLPQLHLAEAETLTGQLALNRLKLRATLVPEDGVAHLRAWASGWIGTPRIFTAFGTSPLQPTGAALAISGTGVMTVVRDEGPPPAKKPAAKKATAKKPGAKKPAARKAATKKPGAKKRKRPAPPPSTLVRLRRALPAPLDPLVRLAGRSQVLRRLYRRG